MKISLKSILFGVAGILGIVAFCMMFLTPLTVKVDSFLGGGNTDYEWQIVYFGQQDPEVKGAVLAGIGYIAMGVGGLLALIMAAVSGQKRGLLGIILTLVTLVLLAGGAVIAFCTKTIYMDVQGLTSDSIDLGIVKGELVLGVGPILGGIIGLVAAVASLLALFVPAPKAKKRK